MGSKVVVAMPVYNEASGIQEFLLEILYEFKNVDILIVIIDDCSQDNTRQIVESFSKEFPNKIIYRRNALNSGHGVSTLRAISESLNTDSEIIITVDGDGQFYGYDIFRTYSILEKSKKLCVVETIRKNRHDPTFRKVISFATRIIVLIKSKQTTADANSPLRAYRRDALEELTKELISKKISIPNIWLSTLIRRKNVERFETEVSFIPRRGDDENSVTWQQRFDFLPSRRLIVFCLIALIEIFKI